MTKRVVITGMGILSPIGNSVYEFNSNLKKGTNGIAPITHFDTSDYNVHIAGGSGVIKNIPDNSKVMGYPAKDLKNFIRENK